MLMAKSMMTFKPMNRALLLAQSHPMILGQTTFRVMSTAPPKIDEEDGGIRPERRLKFSAFARKERDYNIEDQVAKKMVGLAEDFVPKPEFTRFDFDPNIRHRMDDFDNKMIYRSLKYKEPDLDPQSMYVAVQYEGKTWHLFNAARMPLGRIATLSAGFLRGKNKPTYIANRSGDDGDYVVVVNAAN